VRDEGRASIVRDYQLMPRTRYKKLGNPLTLTLDLKNVPLEMYEARNALDVARSRTADKYALAARLVRRLRHAGAAESDETITAASRTTAIPSMSSSADRAEKKHA
jgi:hypothetical protein